MMHEAGFALDALYNKQSRQTTGQPSGTSPFDGTKHLSLLLLCAAVLSATVLRLHGV